MPVVKAFLKAGIGQMQACDEVPVIGWAARTQRMRVTTDFTQAGVALPFAESAVLVLRSEQRVGYSPSTFIPCCFTKSGESEAQRIVCHLFALQRWGTRVSAFRWGSDGRDKRAFQ